MISCQMDFWSRNEGGKALHEFHWSEFDGKGAIAPWFFESVDDFPSDVGGESFFGERRIRSIDKLTSWPRQSTIALGRCKAYPLGIFSFTYTLYICYNQCSTEDL